MIFSEWWISTSWYFLNVGLLHHDIFWVLDSTSWYFLSVGSVPHDIFWVLLTQRDFETFWIGWQQSVVAICGGNCPQIGIYWISSACIAFQYDASYLHSYTFKLWHFPKPCFFRCVNISSTYPRQLVMLLDFHCVGVSWPLQSVRGPWDVICFLKAMTSEHSP